MKIITTVVLTRAEENTIDEFVTVLRHINLIDAAEYMKMRSLTESLKDINYEYFVNTREE